VLVVCDMNVLQCVEVYHGVIIDWAAHVSEMTEPITDFMNRGFKAEILTCALCVWRGERGAIVSIQCTATTLLQTVASATDDSYGLSPPPYGQRVPVPILDYSQP